MFKILKTKQSSSKEEITNKLNKANFGTLFSEHMFTMHYDSENGWHNAQIEPFNNFSLHPASAVFHYGQAIFELVKLDKNFVPKMNDGSLYLRPFMFANQDFLGVGPSSKYIFCIIASSVNNYFKNKANAINIWIEQEYVRAFPGGVGSAKFAGNYAASYAAQQKASQYNCDQVLFLDGINHTDFEELGAMNIFLL